MIEVNRADRQYFEVCIGSGPREHEDDFWMCVCGVREPSIPEAELFCSAEVSRNGGHVLSVSPIDEATARACYDFSHENRWPVFGL